MTRGIVNVAEVPLRPEGFKCQMAETKDLVGFV